MLGFGWIYLKHFQIIETFPECAWLEGFQFHEISSDFYHFHGSFIGIEIMLEMIWIAKSGHVSAFKASNI